MLSLRGLGPEAVLREYCTNNYCKLLCIYMMIDDDAVYMYVHAVHIQHIYVQNNMLADAQCSQHYNNYNYNYNNIIL